MTSADISRLSRTSVGPSGGRPPVAFGVVSRAPATAIDSMAVRMPEYSFDADYQVPAGHWAAKGSALPLVGTRCVIVLDDLGDAWVPEWDGLFVLPTVPFPPGSVPASAVDMQDILQQGVMTGGGFSYDSTTQLTISGGTGYIMVAGVLTRVTWPFATVLTFTAAPAATTRLDQVVVSSAGVVSVLAGTASAGVTIANRTGAAAVPAGSMRLWDVLVGTSGLVTPPSTNYRDRRSWARGGLFLGKRTTNVATASATTVQLDVTAFACRMECSGVPVEVGFDGQVNSNVGNGFAQIDLLIDNAVIMSGHVDMRLNNGAFYNDAKMRVPAPGAGSHYFEVRFAHVNVAGTVTVAGATTNPATFSVMEILRGNASNGSV